MSDGPGQGAEATTTTDRTIWLVGDYAYDSYTPHAAFERQEDADRYANATRTTVEPVPVYVAGTAPVVHTVWHAQAQASTDPRYDAPPQTWATQVSEFSPDAPRLAPCREEAEQCRNMGVFTVSVAAHGTDRAAVEASVRRRYAQAREMGVALFGDRSAE